MTFIRHCVEIHWIIVQLSVFLSNLEIVSFHSFSSRIIERASDKHDFGYVWILQICPALKILLETVC